eukprot:Protomagalhaensia_sp_Gyna_25__1640@NODE_184_length_4560_cov_95_754258_g143_i0_p4_GENE_NODE_184_length_4560_cov_95_754258_g143_i0NODE_184_length_4560_cov_95_754258_g143_i0_p4_ORF_typecomplete_len110_score9_90_NODE_184_length_4560_cov_95_754258_g143_i018242153
MDGSDASFLAEGCNVLSGKHSGVWGCFISVGLNLHATCGSGDGFTAGQICDVDEGVVERGKDVGDSDDVVSTRRSWHLDGSLLLRHLDGFLRTHCGSGFGVWKKECGQA